MVNKMIIVAPMFVYVLTSEAHIGNGRIKIGCTQQLRNRLCQYLTGCCPGLTPSEDLYYHAAWLVDVADEAGLVEKEGLVHGKYDAYRKIRSIPGDSEWFDVRSIGGIETVVNFISSQWWVIRPATHEELTVFVRKNTVLAVPSLSNTMVIRDETVRNVQMSQIQEPVIERIREFVQDTEKKAGYVIAPCGSGKTRMAIGGIISLRRVIVVCPSCKIQEQWCDTLINYEMKAENIHIIGGEGSTDQSDIDRWLNEDGYTITTNASSHLLIKSLESKSMVDMIVIDEAHHMAGEVSNEQSGKGRTRRLMALAANTGIKRMSLTYTPRFVVGNNEEDRPEEDRPEKDDEKSHQDEDDEKILSMDDEDVFGRSIAEMKIRDLIKDGVLPDYRLWMMYDDAQKGAGIMGKVECLKRAWDTREMVNGTERFVMNHLIIFVLTIKEGKEVLAQLAGLAGTEVMQVFSGEIDKTIKKFERAERAILINCYVLGEGVDIPCADSVAIMYPKKSKAQITQMVLRAGRWYPKKQVFHVLIPTQGQEDLSGFEEVLSSLASCDDRIYDEVVNREKRAEKRREIMERGPMIDDDVEPDMIMIETADAEREVIRQCFDNVRRMLCKNIENLVRRICREEKITTSARYREAQKRFAVLPDDPRQKGQSWFDFLNPEAEKMDRTTFLDIVWRNNLTLPEVYAEKITEYSTEAPSMQFITDGYFPGISDFKRAIDRPIRTR